MASRKRTVKSPKKSGTVRKSKVKKAVRKVASKRSGKKKKQHFTMQKSDYNDSVFINCPFDREYKPLFDAVVFAVFDCGFRARCSLEEEDASQIRIEKIYNIISDCKYSIHDISRTEPDANTALPRFNMPLELGIFLGAKKFGIDKQRKKRCLILDREQYRYQQFISDISGQDIKAHNNDPERVIAIVRDWLRNASGRTTIPGGHVIWSRYQAFITVLPEMCNELKLNRHGLIFNDYTLVVTEWLKVQEQIIAKNKGNNP